MRFRPRSLQRWSKAAAGGQPGWRARLGQLGGSRRRPTLSGSDMAERSPCAAQRPRKRRRQSAAVQAVQAVQAEGSTQRACGGETADTRRAQRRAPQQRRASHSHAAALALALAAVARHRARRSRRRDTCATVLRAASLAVPGAGERDGYLHGRIGLGPRWSAVHRRRSRAHSTSPNARRHGWAQGPMGDVAFSKSEPSAPVCPSCVRSPQSTVHPDPSFPHHLLLCCTVPFLPPSPSVRRTLCFRCSLPPAARATAHPTAPQTAGSRRSCSAARTAPLLPQCRARLACAVPCPRPAQRSERAAQRPSA